MSKKIIRRFIPGYNKKYEIILNYINHTIHFISYKQRKPVEIRQAYRWRTSTSSRHGSGPVYKYVSLYKAGKHTNIYIHRLVAQMFIPNPNDKPFVNHYDGDSWNNFPENLEWVTPRENSLHAYRILSKHPAWLANGGSQNRQAVYKVDPDTMIALELYNSMHQAETINGYAKALVRRAATKLKKNGSRKKAGGFFWVLATDLKRVNVDTSKINNVIGWDRPTEYLDLET